ncbi:diguanylate cyclase domain-containing protein [Aestuariibius insulae]|uniref:diguanylate cyclase domain-containing protein n=1 Tax=Aestuariibius insulae TaxID=2058287 RepID=UPI00345F1296
MERITSWFVATTLLGCLGRIAAIVGLGSAGALGTSGLASQIFLVTMLCAPLVMAILLLAQSWPSLSTRSLWSALQAHDRLQRLSDPFSTGSPDRGVVLCLDRAHLRRIGMRHGTPAAERCIDQVESAVLENIRPGDVIARLNESEICVWLRNVSDENALTIGTRLCRLVPVTLESGPTLLIAPVPGAVLKDPPIEMEAILRETPALPKEGYSSPIEEKRTGTDG